MKTPRPALAATKPAPCPRRAIPRSSAKSAEQHRAGKCRLEHDAPARDRRREARTGAHRNGEQREIDGDRVLIAADQRLDQRRQQRQHHDADQPEPARHHGAPPQPRVGAQMPDHRRRRSGDIERDLQMRRALAGRRNGQRRQPADKRKADEQRRERHDVAAARCQPADDGAGEDGDEGGAFHQRVAGR